MNSSTWDLPDLNPIPVNVVALYEREQGDIEMQALYLKLGIEQKVQAWLHPSATRR